MKDNIKYSIFNSKVKLSKERTSYFSNEKKKNKENYNDKTSELNDRCKYLKLKNWKAKKSLIILI